jgi:hypothetical protein
MVLKMQHADDCTCSKCKKKDKQQIVIYQEMEDVPIVPDIQVTTVIPDNAYVQPEYEPMIVPLIEPKKETTLKKICNVGIAICNKAVYVAVGMFLGVVIMAWMYNWR